MGVSSDSRFHPSVRFGSAEESGASNAARTCSRATLSQFAYIDRFKLPVFTLGAIPVASLGRNIYPHEDGHIRRRLRDRFPDLTFIRSESYDQSAGCNLLSLTRGPLLKLDQ